MEELSFSSGLSHNHSREGEYDRTYRQRVRDFAGTIDIPSVPLSPALLVEIRAQTGTTPSAPSHQAQDTPALHSKRPNPALQFKLIFFQHKGAQVEDCQDCQRLANKLERVMLEYLRATLYHGDERTQLASKGGTKPWYVSITITRPMISGLPSTTSRCATDDAGLLACSCRQCWLLGCAAVAESEQVVVLEHVVTALDQLESCILELVCKRAFSGANHCQDKVLGNGFDPFEIDQ